MKPANIIRTPEGSARLVDFGIARIGGMHTLTPTSKILGTPEYMAPELFNNRVPSQRTDLWSLGATLYYALEGRSPFARSTIHATIGALLGDGPPPPPRRPGPLADLVLRMLTKQPRARPGAVGRSRRAAEDRGRRRAQPPAGLAGPAVPPPARSGRSAGYRRTWAGCPRSPASRQSAGIARGRPCPPSR